jgi:hypothetical protein
METNGAAWGLARHAPVPQHADPATNHPDNPIARQPETGALQAVERKSGMANSQPDRKTVAPPEGFEPLAGSSSEL